ncbi:MAG: HNH endonuclease [Oscillospiraceae bacterium]|nr:HNH endonuclease [Oscillospiraceae bacterium]
MDGDHIIPYSPIPASGQENGKTTPDNLQMLCHACNSDKRNHPFNKKVELKKLKKVYEMSPAEVAQLPEGSSNG